MTQKILWACIFALLFAFWATAFLHAMNNAGRYPRYCDGMTRPQCLEAIQLKLGE
jgi:hypothetical protein